MASTALPCAGAPTNTGPAAPGGLAGLHVAQQQLRQLIGDGGTHARDTLSIQPMCQLPHGTACVCEPWTATTLDVLCSQQAGFDACRACVDCST